MDPKHREILRHHWSFLRRDLEPKKLLPCLVNILDDTDDQEIRQKDTREESSDKLLEILPRRGPEAFIEFVKALQTVQPHLAKPLIQAEIEEMKTELTIARTHSARLREEVLITRKELDKEQQTHRKTLKELEELRSLHEKMVKERNDAEYVEAQLQELKAINTRLEGEVRHEQSQKEVFKEETMRLRQMCDHLDESNKQTLNDLQALQGILKKTSEENHRELVKTLLDVDNNKLNESFSSDKLLLISRQGEIVDDAEILRRNSTPRLSLSLSLSEDTDVEFVKTKKFRNDSISPELLNDTRKDLARVTEEREDLKERCENLEKQLEEANANLERQLRTANQFQDRATSPGEPKESEIKDESCSRCEKLEEELNLITTERDSMSEKKQNLDKEVLKMKNRIKEISEDYQREKLTLQKELQILKEERENLSRKLEATNEQQQGEMKVLQGKNEELTDQINRQTSEVHKITVQLMRERTHLEKSQEELVKTKKKLARETKKVKEVRGELEAESKAKVDAMKQIDELKNDLRNQDTHTGEEISRLREETSAERSRCEALIEEVQRLRNMPGRILNYNRDFDRHGVLYALATNFGNTTCVNPGSNNASPTQIIATRSSDDQGEAEDVLENRRGTLSGTKDQNNSWWCIDLTEKYVLYLTHYTLRHGRDNGLSIIRNWRLEGSLDGRSWKTLKKHDNDRGLKDPYPYYTCTWSVDGELGAFRYFRIFQTGKNSSGRFGIFLSGIELYGVLIERGSQSF